MNFRQRLAWLMVMFYLVGTFSVVYYLFEINEHYNKFAVEHTETYHRTKQDIAGNILHKKKQPTIKYLKQSDGQIKKSEEVPSNQMSIKGSYWHHMIDVPIVLWALLLLLPYLQMFFMILACTKHEPKMSFAYQWPCLAYLKYKQLIQGSPSGGTPKPVNSPIQFNGHTVFDT